MHCYHCQKADLSLKKNLGNVYAYGLYENRPPPNPQYPLRPLECQHCGHIQLESSKYQIPSFSYTRQGQSQTRRRCLRELGMKLTEMASLNRGDYVLDLECNDGTFLRLLDVPQIYKVGFEKADNLIDEAKSGLDFFFHKTFSKKIYDECVGKKAKLVVAINLLPKILELRIFLKNVLEVLSDEGIFFLELKTLSDVIEELDFGFINLNNNNYFSFGILESLLEEVGFSIIDVEKYLYSTRIFCIKERRVEKREEGNSFLRKSKDDQKEREKRYLNAKVLDLKYSSKELDSFFSDLDRIKNDLIALLKKLKIERKKIMAYGATERGYQVFQVFELYPYLSGVVDQDSEKWNKYWGGTDFKCYSPHEALSLNSDYYLVFPKLYLNEIFTKEKAFRNRGGKFISIGHEIKIID